MSKAVDWLENHGLDPTAALDTINRHPSVLGYNLEKNMDKKIEFFEETLNFTLPMKLKILTVAPDILGRSLIRLRSNLKAIEDVGITGDSLER